MTKLYLTPITVQAQGDLPRSFVWQNHRHLIARILKRWVVRVDWWRQEVLRYYYQVECSEGGLYEIYRERDGWFLERLYD